MIFGQGLDKTSKCFHHRTAIFWGKKHVHNLRIKRTIINIDSHPPFRPKLNSGQLFKSFYFYSFQISKISFLK